jgi:integrase
MKNPDGCSVRDARGAAAASRSLRGGRPFFLTRNQLSNAMTILANPTAPLNPAGDALAALDRWMIENGSYDAAARAGVKDHVRLAGNVPAYIIRPEHLTEAETVWRVAHWLSGPAIAAAAADLPAVGRVPWVVFEPILLAEYGPRLRSKGTLRAVKHAIKTVRELGVTSPSDLNISLISRVVETRDPALSPNTVRKLLRGISAIASHAVEFGYLSVSPFARRPIRSWVRARKPQNARHLTRAEMRKILEIFALDVREKIGWAGWRARRDQAVFVTLAFTGMRKKECLFLRVEDVDLAAGVINLVDHEQRTLKTENSAQPIPVVPPLAAILREWLLHREDSPDEFVRPPSCWLFPNLRTATPWVEGSRGYKPIDRFKAVASRAGVESATFQMIRRSVATHLEATGCGEAMIMRILRHSNVQVGRDFYRKRDLENMTEAMKDFDY